MAKKSLKDVKVNNTAQVLEHIMRKEQISRIEIAEITNLSPSTVSQAVSLLMEDGIVEELRAGESTGGRKPILLRLRPDYGCIVTVEIKRDSVEARVFDMGGSLMHTQQLSGRRQSGNALLKLIVDFVTWIQRGEKTIPAKIIGLGLLCQDDIPEYDLMTEFSTSLSSDLIRLDTALATRYGIPVKRELINRYSLDFYLKTVDAGCTDYAYVNVGARVTASFVLNKMPVRNPNGAVFDISAAVLSGSLAGKGQRRADGDTYAKEFDLKKISLEKLSDMLTGAIKSALLFFPVNDVFIGGQIDGMELLVNRVAGAFPLHPVIRRVSSIGKDVNGAFAREILLENYKNLVVVR